MGKCSVCGETFRVYIGSVETNTIDIGRQHRAIKRKFTLI